MYVFLVIFVIIIIIIIIATFIISINFFSCHTRKTSFLALKKEDQVA